MPHFRTTGFLLGCALALFHPAKASAPLPPPQDSRLHKIHKFLTSINSPIHHLAPHFLRAADRHGLDWRLLPSLAFVESTAGKHSRRNNIFGWGNGRVRFSSIAAGIDHVAAQLATSHRYRHKPLPALLNTYNPIPGYPDRVLAVMSRLAAI